MPSPDAEAVLEAETIRVFRSLGWSHLDAEHEVHGPAGTLGRDHRGEVVLRPRLRAALHRLNPTADPDTITAAIEQLTTGYATATPVEANRQLYKLLKDGVKVPTPDDDGGDTLATLRVLDWDDPTHNDFLLVSQLWVTGDVYTRRADLVGFVNGLPLLFVELKRHARDVADAYYDNLRDYKASIPHLFWYNAFIILSNGSETRVGSLTADWDHFAAWKKINAEGERGLISLDTTLRATCDPARFLDLVENFILYNEARGGLTKLVAMNHQYLGVNNAVDAVRHIRDNRGRLGVFWHTQGSGKSYSMAFFTQKVFRKLPGNWTFLLVTDRQDLDEQLYKNFARVGIVTEEPHLIRPDSGADLRRLLTEDHRYLFTLIHKFNQPVAKPYSDRSDIIVITDEAHRSQYATLAHNMRAALPNAGFLGFTGTPLIAEDVQRTREEFGDYVSIYNFADSVADHATVPLYYEARIPELQLANDDLNTQMEDLLDRALVDEDEERQVERQFAQEYQLITRDDRLDQIAADLVDHFLARGYLGKAMVVSIDKATAVRMYDKVQHHWAARLADLEARLPAAPDDDTRAALAQHIRYMRETDMAVVVSAAQNEVEDLAKKGADIRPHRLRLQKEPLDEKFKDPADPLRIVFVCAMWMTGFDVPACSTIYLDKPMRNHTLMQTIARANRVFGDKQAGLIVDYIGVFRNLQQALAIYAATPDGGDTPIRDKDALVADLTDLLAETRQFLHALSIDIDTIDRARGLPRIALVDAAVESLLVNDDTRQAYLNRARAIDRLYAAILPDRRAAQFLRPRTIVALIAEKLRRPGDRVDIDRVMTDVESLLDASVVAGWFTITAPEPGSDDHLIDLSQLDFDALRQELDTGHTRTAAERLKGQLNAKVARMVRLNRSRMDYQAELQRMIDDYNRGALSPDSYLTQLLDFTHRLSDEEQRAIRENLTEEELALFDILTKPDPTLTPAQEAQVKAVARDLLTTLKNEKLVLDWRNKLPSRAAVRSTILTILDRLPDTPYPKPIYDAKVDAVYQHIYDAYPDATHSIYAHAS